MFSVVVSVQICRISSPPVGVNGKTFIQIDSSCANANFQTEIRPCVIPINIIYTSVNITFLQKLMWAEFCNKWKNSNFSNNNKRQQNRIHVSLP